MAKSVEYRLQMHVNSGSGLDSWVIINSLTCNRNITKIIQSSRRIIFLENFKGYAFKDKTKSVAEFLYSRCGRTYVNFGLKKSR